MANIVMNLAAFACESPVIGTTTRNNSNYSFNYTTKGALYQSYGLAVTIKLFYGGDGAPVNTQYTATTVPFNATNFTITPPSFDTTDFRIEFSVDNGSTCFYAINIPYSSIIIT
jgi:hypothetical protein